MNCRVRTILLLALAYTPGLVGAGTIDVSTGLDASGSRITSGDVNDAHWLVNGNPAQTVFPSDPDWFTTWVTNGPNSDWIAKDPTTPANGHGPFTFSTTFNLTPSDLSTAALSGGWAVDDFADLYLNGNHIAAVNNSTASTLTSFSAPNSDFVAGVNTLSINLGSDNAYAGIRLDGEVTGVGAAPTATPEPASIVLVGAAVCGMGLVRWRRNCARR